MIRYIKTLADQIGCEIALYNHHGWFGNPHHQVKIMELLQDSSITMVYNFHHAHEFIDIFAEVAEMIQPYLFYVNLNGMKKGGPQILALGQGDHELEMIKALKKVGYDGPWGILGHIKTGDVEIVLRENLAGIELLNAQANQ